MINSEIIRKITIGSDLKNAMTYQLGSVVNGGKYKITTIFLDPKDFAFFGAMVYKVCCREGDGPEFVWQSFKDFDNLRIEYVKAD